MALASITYLANTPQSLLLCSRNQFICDQSKTDSATAPALVVVISPSLVVVFVFVLA